MSGNLDPTVRLLRNGPNAFYNWKKAKNEPKMRDFQNLPKTRLKMIFFVKQESIPPFLGIVGDKKWSPFLDF